MELKKLKKDHFIQRLHRYLSNRLFITMLVVVLQLSLFFVIFYYASFHFYYLYLFLSTLVLLHILAKGEHPSYQLSWVIVVFLFPYIGIITYILYGGTKIPKKLQNEIMKEEMRSVRFLQHKTVETTISQDIKNHFVFLEIISNFPYAKNTAIEYYSSGELMFEEMLVAIEQAKNFIFLEYFIIDKGFMLEKLMHRLETKVKEGVQVYLLYDDLGCVNTLDYRFDRKLKERGIDCCIFNPISVKRFKYLNNRDHRKMTIIDNRIAFMGGANIADEYINRIKRFGHWKDTGIKIEGEAVLNCTMMFLQFYNAVCEKNLPVEDFLIQHDFPKSNDLTLPFSDSPTDDRFIGKDIHIQLIAKAKHHIYIHSPYLILDYELRNALIRAKQSGVEVIITCPFIPDKKSVFLVTRYNYLKLIKYGIRIFEYSPGFIHSKLMMVDDQIALIGTINMDYRSYYLNFECACLFSDQYAISKIKTDYIETLKLSKEFTLEDGKKISLFTRFAMFVMSIFSPLL